MKQKEENIIIIYHKHTHLIKYSYIQKNDEDKKASKITRFISNNYMQ